MAEITLTKENFDREIATPDMPVLVDFWAPWCMPCRMLAPVVEELAADLDGKTKVGKVNIDEQPDLASRYRVSSIPTLIVFKGGKEVARSVGAQGKDALMRLIEG